MPFSLADIISVIGRTGSFPFAQKDARIAELERQVEILRVSHIAMMRTVGELGGTSKLQKLYEGYREVRGELDRLGLLPFEQAKAAKAAD